MAPLRRNFMIDSGFQTRFMRFVIIACVFVCSISLLSQYFFVKWLLQVLRDSKVMPFDLVMDLLSISDQLFQMTVFLILGCMTIFIFLAMFYSHRIAGPIYNIKKTIDAVLEGKKDSRVHLRKNDYLVDLADKVNLLLDRKSNS